MVLMIAKVEKTNPVAVSEILPLISFYWLYNFLFFSALRPNSTCLISEFECPFLGGILTNETQIDCIPLAYQCDGNADCTDSGDEFGCCMLFAHSIYIR